MFPRGVGTVPQGSGDWVPRVVGTVPQQMVGIDPKEMVGTVPQGSGDWAPRVVGTVPQDTGDWAKEVEWACSPG